MIIKSHHILNLSFVCNCKEFPCGITVPAAIAKTALATWLLPGHCLKQKNNCTDPNLTIKLWSQYYKKTEWNTVWICRFCYLWSRRKNAGLTVSSPVGNWEQTQHRSSPSRRCPSVHSCFTTVPFTLTLHHLCLLHQQGSFSFCNVEFPVIPVVPQLPASDYNASSSSYSSYAMADVLPLWCNYTLIFVGTVAEQKA